MQLCTARQGLLGSYALSALMLASLSPWIHQGGFLALAKPGRAMYILSALRTQTDHARQAAGERAKLPSGWMPAYQVADEWQGQQGQAVPALATLQLVVTQGTFCLPYDCEFGCGVRAAELWGKAFGDVLTQVSH